MKAKFLVLAFVITAISYSLTRDTDFGVWIKPFPIICCFLLLVLNPVWNRPAANLVLVGLGISTLGDISLDLSATSLGIVIFTIVMTLYGIALFKISSGFSWVTLIPTVLFFGGIYALLFPHLADQKITAAIYQTVLIWMVWRGATVLYLNTLGGLPKRHRWFVFLSTVGIAMNGVLYGIDLYWTPVPRDLVIHSYFVGQLLLVLGTIQNSPNSLLSAPWLKYPVTKL